MASEQDLSAVDSVTMLDVLNEEKEIEDETAAVLGGSDEKNCTYNQVINHPRNPFLSITASIPFQGPVKRQALYSCLTCVPESKTDVTKSCGVCLACSYACHENHELVELYTKRNFRCDCGTPKMGKKCSLEEKATDNEANEYNQVGASPLYLLYTLLNPFMCPFRTTLACTATATVRILTQSAP